MSCQKHASKANDTAQANGSTRLFDEHGMYPQSNCTCCGKPLNYDGDHPAELYAGTYNGLCYACTNSDAFVQETKADGARKMNHPPHCPSWRRDREIYIGYEDCPVCKGRGCTRISRPDGQGGDYLEQCKSCSDRYYAHPDRANHRMVTGRIEEDFKEEVYVGLRKLKLYGKFKRNRLNAEEAEVVKKLSSELMEKHVLRLKEEQKKYEALNL